MYYFHFKGYRHSVDATQGEKNDARLGRLINHCTIEDNLSTVVWNIDETPHVVVFASKPINVGDELLYDHDKKLQHKMYFCHILEKKT